MGTGINVPFNVCYSDEGWQPPSVSMQSQHLQAGPRYDGLRGPERYNKLMHDLGTRVEPVHVERQPNGSRLVLDDFIQLSGLWTDTPAANPPCPPLASGTAEMWALQIRLQRFELLATDLTAVAATQSAGVQVVQLSIPPEARFLHVVDSSGMGIASDIDLRAQPDTSVLPQQPA